MTGVPTIYADFNNADKLGRIRLNTNGTLEDFRTLGIQPAPEMRVFLSDQEELCAEGTVEWDEIEGWVARIDWNNLVSSS
jgi:hypothetical protein